MFSSILDLFFPKVCCGCHSILLNEEDFICTSCRHELPLTNQHLNRENEMFTKFYGTLNLQHASAMLYFQKKGIVQQLIHALKYKGQQEIGRILGEWYSEELKQVKELKNLDAIIPVPLHKKRQKERGYNQVDFFCKELSDKLQVPYNISLLKRNIYAKSQTKKSRSGRSGVIESMFEADFTKEDCGKHLLLVDDVMTTGATLEACSKVLLKIPDIKLSIVCMAQTF